METPLAIIAAAFGPKMVSKYGQNILMTGSDFVNASIMPYARLFIYIFFVTVIFSIIKALRNCTKSYGVISGLEKGLIMAGICVFCVVIVNKIPILQIPFMILPVLAKIMYTLVILLAYTVFYFALIRPVYGLC